MLWEHEQPKGQAKLEKHAGQASAPLWERDELRAAAGDTLRPGGFGLTDRAAELAGVVPGWRVLDVGSGLGATVHRLRSRFGARAYGVEPSAVQVARSGASAAMSTGGYGASNAVRGMGDALPFADGVFDAVFCECVLSLMDDAGRGLEEFCRVLAPGGVLVLSDLCAGPVAAGTGARGCGDAWSGCECPKNRAEQPEGASHSLREEASSESRGTSPSAERPGMYPGKHPMKPLATQSATQSATRLTTPSDSRPVIMPRQPGTSPASCAHGAEPLDQTLFLLESAGFRVSLVEDHSRHLKELAARLVFTGGRRGGGCDTSLVRSDGADEGKNLGNRVADRALPSMQPARTTCGCGERGLGYFLLIAHKQGADHV